jgi:hypothetical protein
LLVVPILPQSEPHALSGLPSGDSAEQLVSGDVNALPKVVLHTALRGALIGTALRVSGMTFEKGLVRYSLAGALGIEAFVLVWALANRRK